LNDMAKNLVLWLIIAAVLLSVFQNFSPTAKEEGVVYSPLIEEVRRVRIDGVVLEGFAAGATRQMAVHLKQLVPMCPIPD